MRDLLMNILIAMSKDKHRLTPRNVLSTAVLAILLGIWPGSVPDVGAETDQAEQVEEPLMMGTSLELPDWLRTPDGYVFRSDGKPDPFRPFIRPAPTEEAFLPQAQQRALTPLERVDATQLRVIGIVWSMDRPELAYAMVEMPDGKAYVLRPGVAVGRYGGSVQRITGTEVIIVEYGLDIVGREQTREVILKLYPSEGSSHG